MVADEVRNLACQTHDFTVEIGAMISSLHDITNRQAQLAGELQALAQGFRV